MKHLTTNFCITRGWYSILTRRNFKSCSKLLNCSLVKGSKPILSLLVGKGDFAGQRSRREGILLRGIISMRGGWFMRYQSPKLRENECTTCFRRGSQCPDFESASHKRCIYWSSLRCRVLSIRSHQTSGWLRNHCSRQRHHRCSPAQNQKNEKSGETPRARALCPGRTDSSVYLSKFCQVVADRRAGALLVIGAVCVCCCKKQKHLH